VYSDESDEDEENRRDVEENVGRTALNNDLDINIYLLSRVMIIQNNRKHYNSSAF